MIRDLDACTQPLPAYDLCVVGTGPAGATVVAELAGSGLSICVLESGRLTPTRRGDALRAVESEGIHIKDYSRERVLGGTSTTWAGLSAPLDPIDLAPRPWLERSGWPLTIEELRPLWRAAGERYRFAPAELFGPEGFGGLRERSEVQPAWRDLEEKVFLAAQPAQDFGREQREVFDREDIDTWLDATVARLETDGEGGRVTAAEVRTRGGRRVEVRARAFVLATGGLENARLLLLSELGNEHDQVGRCLMNHPKNYHGVLHLAEPTGDLPYYYGCLYRGHAGYAGLRLTDDRQRERGLLNSYVRFEPLFPWTDSEGVEALVLFAKQSQALMRSVRGRGGEDDVVALRDYSETGDDSDTQNARKGLLDWTRIALRIPGDPLGVASYLRYRLVTRRKPRIRRVRIRNFMEMEPAASNRVVLGAGRDPLGLPVPRVLHDTTERDRAALVELHDVLARELQEQGLGRLETDLRGARPWPIDLEASHHLGTTRMGEDPADSVVDPDGRVHALENLFLAGGSVFPTSGCANPTYTICALSIRLAAHLRRELGAGGER
jgi:choline dehydrogenase-like flavoprotein